MVKIKNGFSYELNGWKYISVSGTPQERGFAYGYLCANDFKKVQEMLTFFMYESYGITWEFIIQQVNKSIKEKTRSKFKEFYDEMDGIAKGCNSAGTQTSIDEIIAWNFIVRFHIGFHQWKVMKICIFQKRVEGLTNVALLLRLVIIQKQAKLW